MVRVGVGVRVSPLGQDLAHGGGLVGAAQLEVGLLLLVGGGAPPSEVVVSTWLGLELGLGLGLGLGLE